MHPEVHSNPRRDHYAISNSSKKKIPFLWGEQQQQAFEKMKSILTSLKTMTMPIQREPMMLYLISTPYLISALLVQEVEGQEQPVYYLSKCLHESELNYPPMEKYCLASMYPTLEASPLLLSST